MTSPSPAACDIGNLMSADWDMLLSSLSASKPTEPTVCGQSAVCAPELSPTSLLLKLQCIYCALKGKTNRFYFSVCWDCPFHFFQNVLESRISGSDWKKYSHNYYMTCVCFVSVSRCWLPIPTILPGRNSVRRYQSFSTIWIRRLDFFWFIIQLLICPGFPYKSVRLESLCLETLGCGFLAAPLGSSIRYQRACKVDFSSLDYEVARVYLDIKPNVDAFCYKQAHKSHCI